MGTTRYKFALPEYNYILVALIDEADINRRNNVNMGQVM